MADYATPCPTDHQILALVTHSLNQCPDCQEPLPTRQTLQRNILMERTDHDVQDAFGDTLVIDVTFRVPRSALPEDPPRTPPPQEPPRTPLPQDPEASGDGRPLTPEVIPASGQLDPSVASPGFRAPTDPFSPGTLGTARLYIYVGEEPQGQGARATTKVVLAEKLGVKNVPIVEEFRNLAHMIGFTMWKWGLSKQYRLARNEGRCQLIGPMPRRRLSWMRTVPGLPFTDYQALTFWDLRVCLAHGARRNSSQFEINLYVSEMPGGPIMTRLRRREARRRAAAARSQQAGTSAAAALLADEEEATSSESSLGEMSNASEYQRMDDANDELPTIDELVNFFRP
ncbi:hypothetical protein GGR50DRAFT_699044 [Xylaria sp. CBS 124048]|nr:hypothetical protein GGR50DRAFT_699044 [Xylaria sp. CBS 124048]